MRLLDALRYSLEKLDKTGIDDALDDAEILVFHAARTERLRGYIDNPEIDDSTFSKIKKLTSRRAKGEPVQYIVGLIGFYGLEIMVGKGVLVPRPETELLVEEAIKTIQNERSIFKGQKTLNILDLCTGSGCIALALAKSFPDANVTGTDISLKALGYAKKNAAANHIKNVKLKRGELFGPVPKGQMFDLIVSNPPYISSGEIPGLQREVRDWEPLEALDGGPDGLDFYRRILAEAPSHLAEGGVIILELGYGQADEVSGIALEKGFAGINVIDDLAGIGRVFKAVFQTGESIRSGEGMPQ